MSIQTEPVRTNNWKTDEQREGHTDKWMGRQTDVWEDGQKDGRIDILVGVQTDRVTLSNSVACTALHDFISSNLLKCPKGTQHLYIQYRIFQHQQNDK